MTTTASTTKTAKNSKNSAAQAAPEVSTDAANGANTEAATEATAWPYHVNPETGRANKCYKVNNCRFGIPADQHYETAAEALAHAPKKDAGDTAPAASEKVPAKRGRPAKKKAAETTEAATAEAAPPKPARKARKPRGANAAAVAVTTTEAAAEVIAVADEVASAETPASEPQAEAKIETAADGILEGQALQDARKHDAKVNKLYKEREEQQALLTGNLRTLAHRMGINLKKRIDPDKVIARAEASESPERIQKYLDWAKGNLAAVQTAQAKIEKLDNDYAGWARFFIVPGGHIHTSTQCRTCNHSWEHPTQFEWLTDFSGGKLEDVVDQHGAVLCTVCFPEAPLDWTNYFDRLAEEKKKTQCSGSATWDYDLDTARLGQPTGNYGICEHCGDQISITSTGKLRAHRAPAVVDAAEAVTAEAAKVAS